MRAQSWAYFFALLFSALALGPALAHLFSLPNKIGLPEERYFVVQAIYAGWSLLGIIVFGALLSTLALAVLVRRQRAPFLLAALGFLSIAGTQALFWSFTFPANRATVNWTRVPDNWEALRAQWEWSHAASAGLNLVAMVAVILSVLAWRAACKDQPAVTE
jgi:hypothetical protein